MATYASAFTVKISSDQYTASRAIDFSIRWIDNVALVVSDKGKGIGTNLFLNQFQAARTAGFERIRLIAMAGVDDDLQWDGYYFWACLGFHNLDVEEFKEWAAAFKPEVRSLSDLMDTEEGRTLWKEVGISWEGAFYLADGHACTQHLKAHLQRKKIDFEIM